MKPWQYDLMTDQPNPSPTQGGETPTQGYKSKIAKAMRAMGLHTIAKAAWNELNCDCITDEDQAGAIIATHFEPLVTELRQELSTLKAERDEARRRVQHLEEVYQCVYCEQSETREDKLKAELTAALARVAELEADRERLKSFAEDVFKNYDCDSDAHKHGNTSACRCCNALKVIEASARAQEGGEA